MHFDCSIHGHVEDSRGAPVKTINLFIAEMRRLRQCGIISLLALCYASLTVYTVLSVATHPMPRSWMDVVNAVGDWKGFFPDPRYVGAFAFAFTGTERMEAVAPPAHSLYLPVFTVVAIGWAQREGLYSGAGAVMLARGSQPFGTVVVRALVAASYIVLGFILYTFVYAAAMPLWSGLGIDTGILPAFLWRFQSALVICGSLAVTVSVIVTLFGGGGSVMAFLLLVTNLDYLAGVLFENIDLPLYIGCLGRICSPAPLYNGGGWIYTFAVSGIVLTLLAVGAFTAVKTRIS